MSNTYFKITERRSSSYFSSGMVQNIPGMIQVLSEARDMQEDHERLDVNVMVRLGAWKPIPKKTWEAMVKRSRDGQSKDAFADINVDKGRAVLSDWLASNGGRTEVAGELDKLAECYKESLADGQLDQERFAVTLYELCAVQTFDTQQQQTAEYAPYPFSPEDCRESIDEDTMREFIGNLFGKTEPKSMEAWVEYAATLDQDGIENAPDFYREFCGELEYISEKAGVETARQIFDMGQGFTLNPFELRTAALLLQSGIPVGEISGLAISADLCSLTYRESGSFPNPMPNASPPNAVGRVSFADGRTREYTDALEYVKAVRDELSHANSEDVHCKTLTDEPLVREAVDKLIDNLISEERLQLPEEDKNNTPAMGIGGIGQ